MENQEIKRREPGLYKGVLFGIFAGSLLGAAAALLYAPKKGRELRKDISKKKNKILKNAENYIKEAKKHASCMIKDGSEKANLILEETKKKMESIKSRANNLFDESKDKIYKEAILINGAFKLGTEAYNQEKKTIN